MVIASTGFFDGVHRGHRAVLDRVCSLAREQGGSSAVITFWPHPRAVLQQDAAKFRLLNSLEEKRKLLNSIGIDTVHTITFDREFSRLTTEEFFRDYLVERFGVTTFVAGYDHRVGSDLNQSQAEMFEVARSVGIKPVRVDEYLTGEADTPVIISSTKIRESLVKGEIECANSMLGYRYGLEGVVVEGQRIGRTIGFPTANIMLYEPLKILPADGVYAVWAESLGRCYRGITNIGTRPTISHMNERTIETHILGFDEDIYGLSFKIEFVKRLRDEQKFASLHELKLQLERDRQNASDILLSKSEQLR